MSGALPILQPFAADLVLVLLHFLWQGTLIAVAVWLALRLADHAQPTTRYAIALLGGALCALAPIVTLVLLRSAVNAGDSPRAVVVDPANAQLIAANMDTIPLQTERAAPLAVWQLGLLGGWSLGVLLMAGRLLIGWLSVQRLRRQTGPVAQDIRDMVARHAARLGLRRLPRMAVSSRVTEAMVVGLMRPLILLPASWLTELPPDVLSAVLAHELAHIRRLDPWVNAMQRVVETLLFYHPGVWWLSRRLRIEREFCCDELAVRITGQPLVYARTLELVAHRRLNQRIPTLATGIGDRKMTLLKRVQHVLGVGREDRPRSLLTPLAAVFVVLLGLAVYRAAWFGPAPLLADDEPRREREGERTRGGDDDRERDERRERQSVDRRERGERADDGEDRERRNEDVFELELEGDVSPEARELIRELLAQIDELRSRLRERDIEVEARDVDRDGELDIHVFRERDEVRREEIEREGVGERRHREREADDRPTDAVLRVRVIREGDRLRLEEEIEGEHRERREEPARRLLQEADEGREHDEAHLDRRDAHREEHAERREDHSERRADREERHEREFQPTPLIDRPVPRVRAEPEHRDGLAAEVRELREQVRDLAELVGDLRNALREQDEARGEVEEDVRTIPESERQRIGPFRPDVDEQDSERERDDQDFRRDQRRTTDDELRRPREADRERDGAVREESAEAEHDGEESARIETDEARRYTLRSTRDGNVRVYIREGDQDSVLEARIIELTDDGRIKLETANPESADATPFDAAGSDTQDGGDATDPFSSDEAAGDAADGTADPADEGATDPFAVDE